jgi:hypothetical protein
MVFLKRQKAEVAKSALPFSFDNRPVGFIRYRESHDAFLRAAGRQRVGGVQKAVRLWSDCGHSMLS